MTAKTWQLSHLKYMAEERKKERSGRKNEVFLKY
jgi:hypothetical protein